jgi:ABC-type dipeptide/oligopeptide/nickel transport system permease component
LPWAYVLRRLLIALVQLAVISVVVFFLMRALPADPVGRLVGFNASPQAIAFERHLLHLDQSVPAQLAIYLGLERAAGPGLLQADLGQSWTSGEPVATEIRAYLPITLELITYSFLVGWRSPCRSACWPRSGPAAC